MEKFLKGATTKRGQEYEAKKPEGNQIEEAKLKKKEERVKTQENKETGAFSSKMSLKLQRKQMNEINLEKIDTNRGSFIIAGESKNQRPGTFSESPLMKMKLHSHQLQTKRKRSLRRPSQEKKSHEKKTDALQRNNKNGNQLAGNPFKNDQKPLKNRKKETILSRKNNKFGFFRERNKRSLRRKPKKRKGIFQKRNHLQNIIIKNMINRK